MVKLAANVSMMFTEVDLLDRLGQAAAAGFGAVEIHAPYDLPKERVAAAAKRIHREFNSRARPPRGVTGGVGSLIVDRLSVVATLELVE